MASILYLVHRIPYPPNKGDKVRSYNLLRHLSARHRVFLGAFVDDIDDEPYIPALRSICEQLEIIRLRPTHAKVRSLSGLITGCALTLAYYQDRAMRRWVRNIVAHHRIDCVIVFSSAMAQYLKDVGDLPVVVDFVDVDSAKWSAYASTHSWPLSWLYLREGRRLLEYERSVALRAVHSFFVTENEVALFHRFAPECSTRISAMNNGVDCDYFSPVRTYESPFAEDGVSPIVFTGAMDYWPNVDAVRWFALEILPKIRNVNPLVRFYVVGRNPSDSVLSLSSDAVVITGTVADVRPYLQHAGLIVAPLRVARGIQNKILEAMAMGRAVVASEACTSALDKRISAGLLSATSAEEFTSQVNELLDDPERTALIGEVARRNVVDYYSWSSHMAAIDPFIEDSLKAIENVPRSVK